MGQARETVLKTGLVLSMFIFDQLSRPTDFQSVSPGGHKSAKVVFELKIMTTVISNNGKNGKSRREQFQSHH